MLPTLQFEVAKPGSFVLSGKNNPGVLHALTQLLCSRFNDLYCFFPLRIGYLEMLFSLKPLTCVLGCLAILLMVSQRECQADVVFYTSEVDWRSDVQDEEDFAFNAANVGLATELGAAPGGNDQLGGTLTFESTNTGLSTSFVLSALQAGAGFTFDDNEGGGPEWDDALSVGDIDNFENDDWQITFDSSSVFSFGWFLQDNDPSSTGESFSVFDKASDTLIGTFTAIPNTDGIDFVGFRSTVAVGRVVFDEDATGDDIAIGGVIISSTAVPEPSGTAFVSALLALAIFRRGRKF